jgi:hypothetical protein
MATKVKKEYTTIKIGEYESTTKKAGKHIRKVFSRIDKKVAAALGVTGKDGGERIIRKIKKGRAAGAQYADYQLGTKGKGYGLKFLNAGISSDIATKTRNLNTAITTIPLPAGTPLKIVAKFAQTLKRKPIAIVTPKGKTHYLNNSKNSQGK